MSDKSKSGYSAYTTESREGLKTIMTTASWIALFALIMLTGIHAVSIVMRHHSGGSGALYTMQVATPVMTEVFTALVTVGFALHVWRGVQRWLGLSVEVIWILFASLNLVSEFTMQAGELTGLLDYWVRWGLPVSAIVTGTIFYFTLRTSPKNKRVEAEEAAEDDRIESDFAARQEVYNSAEFEAIRRRRAWLDTVNDLRRKGYDDHEISFMTQRTPQLNGYNPPDGRTVIEGQTADDESSSAPPTRRSWRDWTFGRRSAPDPAIVNSTHDTAAAHLVPDAPPVEQGQPAPAVDPAIVEAITAAVVAAMSKNTHDTDATIIPLATPAPGQGQGNGPAAKPLGRDAQNPTPRP